MEFEQKRLNTNEDPSRTIIETAHDLIWTLDTKGNFTFFNRRCEETSGYGLSDLIDNNFTPLIHPEDLPKVQEVFLKTLQGNPQSYEVRAYDRDGKMFILSVNTAPLYEKNKIIGTVSFGRDITENKMIEESLRESEERYRRLVEFSPYGIAIHCECKFVYVNLAATKIFGATYPDEIIGKPIMDFIHPDYHEIVKDRIRSEEEGKIAPLIEEKFLRSDGSTVDVEIVSIPFIYEGKKAMYGVFLDITERKQALEALHESETRYRDLVENARDIIFTISPDGILTSLNTAFETITGWQRGEWLGKTFLPIVHPDDLSLTKSICQHIINGVTPPSFELRILQKSGNYVLIEFILALQMHKGEVKSILGIARDVTDRKKIEEMRLENERLLIASKAKSDFFATLSHELRTPLTSIIGFSELLKDRNIAGELNEKQKYFVDKILANSNHLLTLIDELLDLSKIEAGKIELFIEKFAVPAVMGEAIALIKEIAVKCNIIIKQDIEPLDIEADKKRFKQILLNLLSNAVKFSKKEGGTVTIVAKKSGNMAQISVSDTGIGIKKEDIGRLFRVFEQLDSGITRKYGGTGLGLAISKRLVELHGGRIEIESNFDKGSTFTFLIPLETKKERS